MIESNKHCYREGKKRILRRIALFMVNVPLRKRVARYIKARRVEAGLSIKEAATRVGVRPVVLICMEWAWQPIPVCHLTLMRKAYGVNESKFAHFMARTAFIHDRRLASVERSLSRFTA